MSVCPSVRGQIVKLYRIDYRIDYRIVYRIHYQKDYLNMTSEPNRLVKLSDQVYMEKTSCSKIQKVTKTRHTLLKVKVKLEEQFSEISWLTVASF